ncbi:hypothetical protein EDC01DRAFT_775477 [Geopyxis carbonaria]|nr:hypothetical protein EDC01DRAFT_775477 [Geopyxis carbonaria]
MDNVGLVLQDSGSVKCDTTSGSPRLHEIDFVINRIRKWAPVGLPCNRNLNKCRVVARNENHVVVSTCGVDWSGWSCWEIADR